jgi:hypothetical protein
MNVSCVDRGPHHVKFLIMLTASVLCLQVVVTSGMIPALAADFVTNNSTPATSDGGNGLSLITALPPSDTVASATPTAIPSLLAPAEPGIINKALNAPIVGAPINKDLNVTSVTPSTATVASQPDKSSFLNVSITCSHQGGWQRLGTLHLWLCDSTGNVVPGFSEMQITHPPKGSGTGATYPATIEFKFWYSWNPSGGSYQLKAIVDSLDGTTSSPPAYLGAYTYTRTTGFTVDGSATLSFGSLTYDQISATQQIAIHNSGNGFIAVYANATDWTSPAIGASSVPVSSLQVSIGGVSWQSMSTGNASIQNLQITNGPSTSTPLYWRIVVPSEEQINLAGQYSTTIIITIRPV